MSLLLKYHTEDVLFFACRTHLWSLFKSIQTCNDEVKNAYSRGPEALEEAQEERLSVVTSALPGLKTQMRTALNCKSKSALQQGLKVLGLPNQDAWKTEDGIEAVSQWLQACFSNQDDSEWLIINIRLESNHHTR
jgi:hypothetical protein